MHDLRVSVIVTCYNSEAWIARVLASLQSQTYPMDRLEIIVVDDGSSDRTTQIVQNSAKTDSRIRLIVQENRGTAEAVTTGLQTAKGDVICLLSHDCYAAPDWIARVVKTFEEYPRVGIVQGPILPAGPVRFPVYHCTVVVQPSRSFEGAAIAYRAIAVDDAGRYFDVALSRYGDDADMAWRILEQGYTFAWLTDPVAYHEVVPEPFWKAVKKSLGVSVFPLLVKRHPGMQKQLHFGCLWGNKYRYIKTMALHLAIFMLVAGEYSLSSVLIVSIIFISWYESLRDKVYSDLPFHNRLWIIPLYKTLTQILGTYALIVGSIRYRKLVL